MTKPFVMLAVAVATIATTIAAVLPGQLRNTITLSWDYGTNSPPDVYKLYASTSLTAPTTGWTLIATVPGSIQEVTLSNVVAQQRWFYVTASNWWGESPPSNTTGTPQPPGQVTNMRISQ